MLLFIDAGNTRIKWALAHESAAPGAWIRQGAAFHDELQQAAPWEGEPVRRVVVSNVAGQSVRNALGDWLPDASMVEWFVAQDQAAGIVNRYRNPQQLGSDRFASAIAARALYPHQNLLVVTAGTATTIDAVNADGEFIGGMIAPGLKLMAQALALNTAQLPQVSDTATHLEWKAHLADHTEAAILSGCVAAQVGAIEYAAREFVGATHGEPLCLLSGGAARYLQSSLRIPFKLVDNLVLTGLQVYSQQ